MALKCPHCGVELPASARETCPVCYGGFDELPPETGITSSPSGPHGRYSEGAPPFEMSGDMPSVAKPPRRTAVAPVLIVIVSALLFAWGAGNALAQAPHPRTLESSEALVGGIIGALVGLAVAVDYWWVRRKIDMLALACDDDPPVTAEVVTVTQRPSEWISVVMLVLPIAFGPIGWFSRPLGLSEFQVAAFALGAVWATAVLGYLNMRQMVLRVAARRAEANSGSSLAFAYLGILGFWVVCYPVHFIVRRRMGGRNLIFPALLAAAVYLAPTAKPFFFEDELPPMDDPQVLAFVKGMVEEARIMGAVTVRNPVEVSFDAVQQVRICRCTAVSAQGERPVAYKIDWQDRGRGIWQVQILPGFAP